MGWQRWGDTFTGWYRVGAERFQGEIAFRSPWSCSFKVLAAEELIACCGIHARCFIPQGKPLASGLRWFEVHFDRRPQSVEAGIVAIEQMLRAAQFKRNNLWYTVN